MTFILATPIESFFLNIEFKVQYRNKYYVKLVLSKISSLFFSAFT